MRSLVKKILSVARLAKLTASARARGKKVVFTNGCFDILHKGHVRYLEMAKAQGDILVVALNGDRSVRALKGVGRPINSLRDRQEVMAALEAVDYVTSFDDLTPLKAILRLKPGILVKGGDWKADSIVGGKEVLSWGGQVRSLNFVKGRSTTRIIKKISR